MKKRDYILSTLSNNLKLDKIIKNLCDGNSTLHEEGKQELFILLCEMPEDKLINMYENKELFYWIVSVLKNFFRSGKSTFYNKIRKFTLKNKANGNTNFPDVVDINSDYTETKFNSLIQRINQLPEFDRRMIEEHLKCQSIPELAKKLNLNYQMVLRILKRIKTELKIQMTQDLEGLNEYSEVYVNRRKYISPEEDDEPAKPINFPHMGYNREVEAFELENYNGPVTYGHN